MILTQLRGLQIDQTGTRIPHHQTQNSGQIALLVGLRTREHGKSYFVAFERYSEGGIPTNKWVLKELLLAPKYKGQPFQVEMADPVGRGSCEGPCPETSVSIPCSSSWAPLHAQSSPKSAIVSALCRPCPATLWLQMLQFIRTTRKHPLQFFFHGHQQWGQKLLPNSKSKRMLLHYWKVKLNKDLYTVKRRLNLTNQFATENKRNLTSD